MIVGIVGGGQLGRMMALAGYPLGLRFRFLEPKADPPVSGLGEVVRADYDDPVALDRFVRGVDVVTYEFENVPVEAARRLVRSAPVRPAPAALEMAQDRLVEKERFRELGIPTAPFRRVDDREDLDQALDALGTPAVLKARRFGYDGKAQRVIQAPGEADRAWTDLGGRPLILEGFVDFRRELSVIGVRGPEGATAFYPLVENQHEEGILVLSLAPAEEVEEPLQRRAESYAGRILEALDYIGVLALELFDIGEELLANEMAPRVHNSGHWTQDGAETSQFENHLRAVCGLPLGVTAATGPAAMRNLLGTVPPPERLLSLPGVHLHLYDKAPRPRRKLGHVNVRAEDRHQLRARLRRVESVLRPEPAPEAEGGQRPPAGAAAPSNASGEDRHAGGAPPRPTGGPDPDPDRRGAATAGATGEAGRFPAPDAAPGSRPESAARRDGSAADGRREEQSDDGGGKGEERWSRGAGRTPDDRATGRPRGSELPRETPRRDATEE